MVWLFIIGAVIVLFASGLTGELIQTQVLHNTTPIAQRGAMSDFIIGAIFWIVIGAVVFAVRRRIAVNENLRARRDADIAAEQQRERDRQDQIKQHDKAQREVGEMLQTKNRYAVDQFEKLPLYVSNAHQYLDIAEQEFKETAYVPFWTAIENATNELGRFIDGISVINRTASEYHSLAESYKGPVDPFAISLDATAKLGVSQGVSGRIEHITRPAHRDPDFSQIYLLMRGNAIMVAGFANLGDALGRMTASLLGALSGINDSVRLAGSSINGLTGQLSAIDTGIKSLDASTRSVERATRGGAVQVSTHFRELERQQSRSILMLDNIQRDRKPPFFVR
jgi:hypothetical protein